MNRNQNLYGYGTHVILTEEERPNQLQENSSGSLYGIVILFPLNKCNIIFLQYLTL